MSCGNARCGPLQCIIAIVSIGAVAGGAYLATLEDDKGAVVAGAVITTIAGSVVAVFVGNWAYQYFQQGDSGRSYSYSDRGYGTGGCDCDIESCAEGCGSRVCLVLVLSFICLILAVTSIALEATGQTYEVDLGGG